MTANNCNQVTSIIETMEKQLYKNRFATIIKQPYRIDSQCQLQGDDSEMFLIYREYGTNTPDFTDSEKAIFLLFQNMDIKRKTQIISELLSMDSVSAREKSCTYTAT